MNGTFENLTGSAPGGVTPAQVLSRSGEYQRKRLWCGITGIGLVLVALWIGAAAGLAGWTDGLLAGLLGGGAGTGVRSVSAAAIAALGLGAVAVLLQLPVDLAAINIEKEFGQVAVGTRFNLPGVYLRRTVEWLFGLTVAGAVFGAAYVYAGKYWPVAAAGALLALAFAHIVYPMKPGPSVALPGDKAAWWDEVTTELRRTGVYVPTAVWYSHGETSLAGGWNGVGPMRRLFLTRTLWDIRPRIAAALISREQAHLELGHRLATAAVTVVWVVVGMIISSRLTPAGMGAGGAVVIAATVMSTWCWVGLLGLLPWLGRRQILEADAFLMELEFSKEEVAETLATLARCNKPDETLPAGIAAIFHPIPTMSQRRKALGI